MPSMTQLEIMVRLIVVLTVLALTTAAVLTVTVDVTGQEPDCIYDVLFY